MRAEREREREKKQREREVNPTILTYLISECMRQTKKERKR